MVESTFQIVLLGFVFLMHLLALASLLRGDGSLRRKASWGAALLLPVIGVAAYMIWGHGPRDAHLAP